jgi:glucose-1-phosphatase
LNANGAIHAVVFDLGKVLVDFDYGIAARRLAQQAALPATEIQPLIDQSPLLYRYECAQMTTREFFEAVQEQIQFRGTFEEFTAAFADIFTEIPEMTRLNGALQQRGVPTFVLSNTNEIAISHVRRNFPFFAHFTGYVFSFEHGVMKPDERIYRITEQLAKCRAEEILFLDDRPENVEGSARAGWRTICHTSSQRSIAEVRSLLRL